MSDNNRVQRRNRDDEGRTDRFVDIDRMVNEGLAGGQVTMDNGEIGSSTGETRKEPESIWHSAQPAEVKLMHVGRAKEIIQSEHHIPVFYGSEPVYLESVDEQEQTVVVRNLLHPEQKQAVRAESLIEGEDSTLC